MKAIKQHIVQRQHEFARHAFFRWLENSCDRDEVACALSQLAFWVASFQDVLAINESRVVDARFREVARRHRAEDSGHDKWFFEDIHRLGMATLTAEELFTKPLAPIRRAAYSLMSEVFRANNDIARITLLLALESTGHIFFEATADWVERVAAHFKLKYFSHFHIEIERRHDLFERELEVFLDAIELGDAERAECMAVVDRSYDAFILIFDTLLASITQVANRRLRSVPQVAMVAR